MRVHTSLYAIARQFSAPAGGMPEYGANHFNDWGITSRTLFKPLIELYKYLVADSRQVKINELRVINTLIQRKLSFFRSQKIEFHTLKVLCIMNGEKQLLKLELINNEQPRIELSLDGMEGDRVAIENIESFDQLYEALCMEVGVTTQKETTLNAGIDNATDFIEADNKQIEVDLNSDIEGYRLTQLNYGDKTYCSYVRV
jgi:hypothetical protein